MPTTATAPSTVGPESFDPEALFQDEQKLKEANSFLANNDLRSAIIAFFALPAADNYVYHAVSSVTLSQVQQAVLQGDLHGLHDWFKDEDGKSVSLSHGSSLCPIWFASGFISELRDFPPCLCPSFKPA
jgi:hypothetical protein